MADRQKTYLAVDLGASSGRVVAGRYDGSVLALEEVYRFSTLPIEVGNTLRIDLDAFLAEILNGIREAVTLYGKVISVGVDSWGGQALPVDSEGRLLEMSHHYRDAHFSGLDRGMNRRMPARERYRITGMLESSLPRLLAHVVGRSPDLGAADRILFLPDYISYRLGGRMANEHTGARISQLLDAHTEVWAWEILDKMGIPRRLFGDIVDPGTPLGSIEPPLLAGDSEPIQIIAVASHDTASAIGATPLETDPGAFISMGTWAILGCELDAPLITDVTYAAGFQNNGAMGTKVGLARNIVGMWLIEECRRVWQDQGKAYSFPEMTDLAAKAKPFSIILDTNSGAFFAPGDMVSRIRRICGDTGQAAPADDGALIRAVLEGLALSFGHHLQLLQHAVGRDVQCLHLVGGAIRNELLNQFISNACGLPVIAGPAEAASAGNVMAQMMADGELSSLEEGRELIKRSDPPKVYEPQERQRWDDAYGRLQAIFFQADTKG